jgi:hypothetical protein
MMAAARSLGTAVPISMIASKRAKASHCRCRAGDHCDSDERIGEIFCGRIALEQFRHHHLLEDDIGEADAMEQSHFHLDHGADDQLIEQRYLVGPSAPGQEQAPASPYRISPARRGPGGMPCVSRRVRRRYFILPKSCVLVEGEISPTGWCPIDTAFSPLDRSGHA